MHCFQFHVLNDYDVCSTNYLARNRRLWILHPFLHAAVIEPDVGIS